MVYKLVTYKHISAEAVTAEGADGWVAVSVFHNREGNYVVLYKRPA